MQHSLISSSGIEVEAWNKNIFIHYTSPAIDDKYKDFKPSKEQIELLTKAQSLSNQEIIDHVLLIQKE